MKVNINHMRCHGLLDLLLGLGASRREEKIKFSVYHILQYANYFFINLSLGSISSHLFAISFPSMQLFRFITQLHARHLIVNALYLTTNLYLHAVVFTWRGFNNINTNSENVYRVLIVITN